jgi:hypothetical protein
MPDFTEEINDRLALEGLWYVSRVLVVVQTLLGIR